jgi:O-antigen ligase
MLALTGSGILIALTTVTTDSLSSPVQAAGGNEITAGLYPAIGLIAAAGYLALLPLGRLRLLGFVPLVILLPAVVSAGSRGVLVAGAAALAFVVVRHIALARRPMLAALLVGISLLVMAQLATSLAGGAAVKYEKSLLSTNASQVLGDRQFLYDRGVALALEHPTLGIGAGGFASSALIYEDQLYPHNIFLELASEEGYVAVFLFGLLLSAAWWARRRAPGGLRSPEAVVVGGLILLGVVEGFFSFDINGNRLLWFALGLAFALPQLRLGSSSTAKANG